MPENLYFWTTRKNQNLDRARNQFELVRKIEANKREIHASDITSIVRKVAGINTVIDRVVENLPRLKQVWICGDLARGVPSGSIDCILIGKELDAENIAGLSGKVHKLVGKKVNAQGMEEIKNEMVSGCLLVWLVKDYSVQNKSIAVGNNLA